QPVPVHRRESTARSGERREVIVVEEPQRCFDRPVGLSRRRIDCESPPDRDSRRLYCADSDMAIERTVCRGTSPITVAERPSTFSEYALVLPALENPSVTSVSVLGSSMNTETVARQSE